MFIRWGISSADMISDSWCNVRKQISKRIRLCHPSVGDIAHAQKQMLKRMRLCDSFVVNDADVFKMTYLCRPSVGYNIEAWDEQLGSNHSHPAYVVVNIHNYAI